MRQIEQDQFHRVGHVGGQLNTVSESPGFFGGPHFGQGVVRFALSFGGPVIGFIIIAGARLPFVVHLGLIADRTSGFGE